MIKANLDRANLNEIILSEANLWNAIFMGCNLWDVDFRGADLRRANFDDADVAYALYDWSQMRGKYRGIQVATCHGNDIWKRDAEDQSYIDILEASLTTRWQRLLISLWAWTDFGRDFWKIMRWALGAAITFGLLFCTDKLAQIRVGTGCLWTPTASSASSTSLVLTRTPGSHPSTTRS